MFGRKLILVFVCLGICWGLGLLFCLEGVLDWFLVWGGIGGRSVVFGFLFRESLGFLVEGFSYDVILIAECKCFLILLLIVWLVCLVMIVLMFRFR